MPYASCALGEPSAGGYLPPWDLEYPKRNSQSDNASGPEEGQAGRELPVPHVLDPVSPSARGQGQQRLLGHVRVALAEADEGAEARRELAVELHAVLVAGVLELLERLVVVGRARQVRGRQVR